MKGFSSKRIVMKADCYRTGKGTVCRRVRTLFSPESLQAGAVKGLKEVNFSKLKSQKQE